MVDLGVSSSDYTVGNIDFFDTDSSPEVGLVDSNGNLVTVDNSTTVSDTGFDAVDVGYFLQLSNIVPPSITNLQDNVTQSSIDENSPPYSYKVSADIQDEEPGLRYAFVSTNKSGSFENNTVASKGERFYRDFGDTPYSIASDGDFIYTGIVVNSLRKYWLNGTRKASYSADDGVRGLDYVESEDEILSIQRDGLVKKFNPDLTEAGLTQDISLTDTTGIVESSGSFYVLRYNSKNLSYYDYSTGNYHGSIQLERQINDATGLETDGDYFYISNQTKTYVFTDSGSYTGFGFDNPDDSSSPTFGLEIAGAGNDYLWTVNQDGAAYKNDFKPSGGLKTFNEPVSTQSTNFNGALSNRSIQLGYRVWVQDGDGNWNKSTVGSFSTNSPPVFNSALLNWTGVGGSENRRVSYSINDPDGDQISERNSPTEGAVTEFTNSSIVVDGVTDTFSYVTEIFDTKNAKGEFDTDFSLSRTGLQEADFNHNESVQRIENTATVSNDGSKIDYRIKFQDRSDNISSLHYSGVVSQGSTVSETATFESDYISKKSFRARPAGSSVNLGENFTALRSLELENSEPVSFTDLGVTSFVNDGCTQTNASNVEVPASSTVNRSVGYSCDPGSVSDTELHKLSNADVDNDTHYYWNGTMSIDTNITQKSYIYFYADEENDLTDWLDRDTTTVDVFIDGERKDNISVVNEGGQVKLNFSDNCCNSSPHEGNHSFSLFYEVDSGDTTTIIEDGGGGGGGGFTVIDRNNGSKYKWSVSALTSQDTQQFQVSGYPAATFTKYLAVENTGDKNVTLDFECVSQGDSCEYVDTGIDTLTLPMNSGEEPVTVSGTLPRDFSEEDTPLTFSIRVTDPEFEAETTGNSVSYVDFKVTNDPITGRLLDLILNGPGNLLDKLTSFRTLESPFEQGNSISYPFLVLPVLISVIGFGLMSLAEWLWANKSYKNEKVVTTVVLFLLLFVGL